MTTVTHSATTTSNHHVLRSIFAVFAGFVTVAALSIVTDQILHMLQFYPPWNEPMFDPVQNAVALSYRIFYTVLGGYITAALAPRAPMRLVAILGAIGLLFATVGAIATISIGTFGPNWYPIALVITAFPCVLLGGLFHRARHRESR